MDADPRAQALKETKGTDSHGGPSICTERFCRRYHVQTKVYASSVIWVDDRDHIQQKFQDNNISFTLDFKKDKLHTVPYNDMYKYTSSIRPVASAAMDWNHAEDLVEFEHYGHFDSVLILLPNYCAAVVHVFEIYEALPSLSPAKAAELGQKIFKVTRPVDKKVFGILYALEKDNRINTDPIAPFNCIDTVSIDSFDEMAQWTAWASTSFFAFPNGSADHRQSETEIEKYLINDFDDAFENQKISTNGYRVFPIINNYFAWTVDNLSSEDDHRHIIQSMEPVFFSLSEGSVSTSAIHNIHLILEHYVNPKEKIPLTVSDMRRYVASVRVALFKTEKYSGSSEKYIRRFFRVSREHLSCDTVRDKLETAISSADNTIQGLQSEHNERLHNSLNNIVLLLTSLALVSVAADAIGLIDFKEEKIFDRNLRVSIILMDFLIAVSFFLGINFLMQIRKPNRAKARWWRSRRLRKVMGLVPGTRKSL